MEKCNMPHSRMQNNRYGRAYGDNRSSLISGTPRNSVCNTCGQLSGQSPNSCNTCASTCNCSCTAEAVSCGDSCGRTNDSLCNTKLKNLPLAMAYVPWQSFDDLFTPEQALLQGTIFKCLNLDFCGRRVK